MLEVRIARCVALLTGYGVLLWQLVLRVPPGRGNDFAAVTAGVLLIGLSMSYLALVSNEQTGRWLILERLSAVILTGFAVLWVYALHAGSSAYH